MPYLIVISVCFLIFVTAGGCGIETKQTQKVEGSAEIRVVFEDKVVQGCIDLFEKGKLDYPKFKECLELTTNRKITISAEGSVEGPDIAGDVRKSIEDVVKEYSDEGS